jgi:NAD(P) transhydrogenase subunit alpha
MYSKNLQAFLGLLIAADDSVVKEFSDEILAASLLTFNGEVKHTPTRELLAGPKP